MYTDMTNKIHGYYSHSATLNVLTHDRHNSSSAIQNVFIPEIYPNKKQSEKKLNKIFYDQYVLWGDKHIISNFLKNCF